MIIFHHIIADSQIVGIGPLMVKNFEGTIESMYQSRQYVFDLHLRNQSVKIESPLYRPKYYVDEQKQEMVKVEMVKYKEEYYRYRKQIAQLIGEPAEQEIV
jgi:hypothetical protein